MNITNNSPGEQFLIAGITPYFLERGVLWFEENLGQIKKKTREDLWWRDHTLFLEKKAPLPFSPFLRKLADVGYVKVSAVENRGEFAVRGGIVDVFAVNREGPLRIEFRGNIVEGVSDIPLAASAKPAKLSVPADSDAYERQWLGSLRSGDYLVHIDHGIGIFRGFVTQKLQRASRKTDFEIRNSNLEFYALEYAPARTGGVPDRLLVPRDQAKKLSRYVGFETPTIHRLGGTVWESTKRKAKEEARAFALQLMELFKKRVSATRPPYPRYPEIETHLAETFDFAETEDQARALEEIHADLDRERPMDRLLLGDVGFGKTEVAIRIAIRAAYAGRQVAVLVPTTILADQHRTTFAERLKGLPVEIAMLTRLTSKKEVPEIIRTIASGKIDILIGTHRLLSKDIIWKNLGLVIIDEEQRFGVKQKEAVKDLRAEIDVLSLSATPIPRTLSLALSRFRDISLIQTPPHGRLPIQTFVLPFSKKIVAEAIASEMRRDGQVFYLWNRIENIELIRKELARLAPRATIAVLHGRMRESAVMRVMHDFRSGAIDILLATTIIENGLDLPAANTLIVANASRLGLAQAYQIRGRIGRGEKTGYAYFLYPARSLTEKGKLRLRALKEAEGLGGGFQIAMKDLEIRGAGNVLGKQQSGAINKVGLNVYAQLLGEALEELG